MPIPLHYTARTAAVDAANIGIDQTLNISADQLDVLTPKRDAAVKQSARGQHVRTLVKSVVYIGSIRVPCFEDVLLPQYLEMREACFDYAEVLTIDATGHRGVDKEIQVVLTGSEMPIPRWAMLRGYAMTIPFQVINNSYP